MTYMPFATLPHSPLISWHSEESGLGTLPNLFATMTTSSHAWPTANKAFYMPISIRYPITITSLWSANGGTASNNFDIGIYTADGTKLISTGSTAQSGTNTIQNVAVTATTINAGQYYIAMAMNGTTGTTFSFNPTSGVWGANEGVYQQTTAFALPATAAFATMVGTNPYFPLCGLAVVPTV